MPKYLISNFQIRTQVTITLWLSNQFHCGLPETPEGCSSSDQDSNIGSRPSDHYFRSVCLSVCLCRVFLSRLWPDFDQTWTYVIRLGL